MSNRVCALFAIRYPVVLGAVDFEPDFSAVVSNAGGLGCLKAFAGTDALLRDRIHALRALTTRPFAVNFPLTMSGPEDTAAKMQLLMEERVPIVITSAGSPNIWTQRLKDAGCVVAHVVPTTYHAGKAVAAGVDAIIAEPAESGGYRGLQEVSAMVLIPSVRRAFPELPLLAAGSVVDGAGMAAVMALGADGVQVGTRFMATVESHTPAPVKELILAATDTSTMIAENKFRPRVSRPELAEAVLGKRRQSQMGQGAALINDVSTVEAVMHELVSGGAARAAEAAEALRRLVTATVPA